MTIWWQAIRPKTLLASLGPVLLATTLAANHGQLNILIFIMTLLCALFLQVSVNLANDLFDGLSGVDNELRLGPQRALHSGLVTIKQLKLALLITVLISICSGCYLIYQGGIAFLLLGIMSILGVFAYSAGPFPLASNALGEVAVFLFFGLIAVLGSFYLQTQTITSMAFSYAVCVGLLSAALMLVNNIRDINSDSKANKLTLAVRLGDKNSRALYKLLLAITLTLHLFTSANSLTLALLPLIICGLFLPSLYKAINTYQGKDLNKLLASTAQFGFVYAISVSISFFLI